MISIVLPTYNEAENIKPMIERVEDVLEKSKLKGEIIIVDDKSPDGTAAIARNMDKTYGNIRVITPEIRKGAGAAHRIGYDKASGDIIITMEADCSCDINQIPLLINKIEEGNDVVVASRYAKGASSNKRIFNYLLSKYGNKFISFISGIPITDFTIAYRAFRKKVNDSITTKENDGNPFLMGFILKADKKGYKVTEIPTDYRERKFGVTKNKVLNTSIRTFFTALRISLFR